MKKFWKYLAISAIAVGAMPMVSCSDDDAVDPYTLNYCYMYQPNSTFAQIEYKATGEWLIDIESPLTLMPVRLTKPAPHDLNVTVAIDESLVAEYNNAHGTDYKFLTGCSILNPNLKIKAGEYISTKTVTESIPDPDDETGEGMISNEVVVNDSVVVSFGDKSAFQSGDENLILPIVITKADGVTISKSSRIFLTFSSKYKANMISSKYLTSIPINPDDEGWETAKTNLTLTNFFNCQWDADDAIEITAQIDNSKIQAFNEANETNYLPLAGSSVESSTISIAQGESTADLQLKLGDYTGIPDGIEYLIPINLELTKGEGAQLEAQTIYVAVINIPCEVYAKDYAQGLTRINPLASWTATEIGIEEEYTEDATFLYNGSNYTYCPNTMFEFDLGEVTTVDVFALRWYSYYYQAAEITDIQLSKDGENWEDWGAAASPSEYASTWYLSFSKPAKFRYMRFVVGDEHETFGYGVYFRQIYFYNK